MSILKGEKIGIIGKTGSGKSTLVDIISGLVTSFEGEILIDNNKFDPNYSKWGKILPMFRKILCLMIASNLILSLQST